MHHAQLWSSETIRETCFVYCIHVPQINAHSTMPKKYLKLPVHLQKCIVKYNSLTSLFEQWWSVVVIAAQYNNNITPYTPPLFSAVEWCCWNKKSLCTESTNGLPQWRPWKSHKRVHGKYFGLWFLLYFLSRNWKCDCYLVVFDNKVFDKVYNMEE